MSGVSVIVPAYNNGPYIAEAIESALRQTVLPDEIIIVDDGSTDGTEQIVKPFLRDNLRYVRQANQGVSTARNTGLDLVKGEYITFLDADDRWRPHMIETQLRLMKAVPELVCCFGNFVRFEHATGELMTDQFQFFPELKDTPFISEPSGAGKVISGEAFPNIIHWGDFPAWLLTMLFRADAIANLRFDRRLIRCQDAHFVLRAFMMGKVGFTEDVLAEVRRHGTNATIDVAMMAVDKLKALECVSEDPLSPRWAGQLDARLLRARFDAAGALVRRGRWTEGREKVLQALRSPGSLGRKTSGALRIGMAAVQRLSSKP